MIGYFARLVPMVLKARFSPGTQLVSTLTRRVRLGEIDFNRHMNQAVYAQVGELGRTDWVLRSGFWQHVRKRRILPVVASQELIYRKELKPFQRYTVDTRAVAVDGRLLVIDSHILVGTRVHTRVTAKLIFIGPDGVLAPSEVPPLVDGYLHVPLQVKDWKVQ